MLISQRFLDWEQAVEKFNGHEIHGRHSRAKKNNDKIKKQKLSLPGDRCNFRLGAAGRGTNLSFLQAPLPATN